MCSVCFYIVEAACRYIIFIFDVQPQIPPMNVYPVAAPPSQVLLVHNKCVLIVAHIFL